jgi:polysaccharide deacetylase family protein (PEP-CTERM system associated)
MTGPAKAVSPDPIVNAMSVDVEDYFHVSLMAPVLPRTAWEGMERRVEGSTERLLALFDRAGVRATFFVLGWVAERHPGLVRRIAALGHEVASHGYGHELVYDLSPARFRDDVRRTRALLEDLSGTAVDGYRAPGFSVTSRSLWALDILIEEGYRYDASIFPIFHDRYGIPEAPRHPHVLPRPAGPVFEVPASTVRIGGVNLPVAGGGYFRLLPYAWTRWGIRRVNRRERKPVVFYLHPWELDPGQPRLPLRGLSAYRHYHNLARTEQRLGRLLREFRFARVRDVWQHELAGVPGLGRLEVPSPCAG